jgi:hypothetical protein
MQQTIIAAGALVVVIMGISKPIYALTRDDCQRAGGTVAPSNRLADFKCCFGFDEGQAEFTSELLRKKVSKICWHCDDRPGRSCSFLPTFEK